MMFAPGRRWFTIASFAMILTAAIHTLLTGFTTPADSAGAAFQDTMRAVRFSLGLGMTPSLWDFFRGLTFTMSLTLLSMGVLGLVLAADREVNARALRLTATVLAFASGFLTVLWAVYQMPPQLITLALVTVLYVVAAARAS